MKNILIQYVHPDGDSNPRKSSELVLQFRFCINLIYLRTSFSASKHHYIKVQIEYVGTYIYFYDGGPKKNNQEPILRYNASVVNLYNSTGSQAHLENKNIIFYF
jgi:hypothetical protein